jgi:hopanoid C-2 methylase
MPPAAHHAEDGGYRARRARRVLCVFPRYAHSFGTFQQAYELMPGVRAFMPPQGILSVAAYLPREWTVRVVDENVRPVSDADLAWGDAVLVSGMHVQRAGIPRVIEAAHHHGKLVAVGGPSVSGCPEYYPDADVIHVGEIGDATDALVRHLDDSVARPARQLRLETAERRPLDALPPPAYRLVDLRRYFLGSIQFSSGCPFRCEFCDIPALYGRVPRLKTPEQVCAELDALRAGGARGAVYFVDDNFVGNPNAARALVAHLVAWQRRTRYPLQLNCEASLNLARHPDLLASMREANFTTVFCGIESPEAEAEALERMRKSQNNRGPMLDAIRTLNAHGLEVVAGIILGLDTDGPDTADRLLQFIEASHIPMLTINLLYALPRTPLRDRLAAAGRLAPDAERASNVVFMRPHDEVLATWRRVVEHVYDPVRLHARFQWQTTATFPNRLHVLPPLDPDLVRFGLGMLARVAWKVGVRADYRRAFWSVAGPLLARGRMDEIVHLAVVAHHLIRFTRDCLRGMEEASFYADPNRSADGSVAPERASATG